MTSSHTRSGEAVSSDFEDEDIGWENIPDLRSMAQFCRKVLRLEEVELCIVSQCAEGGSHKVYEVRTPRARLALRLGLPFDLPRSVKSEVAVADWMREVMGAPSPRVLAYDPTDDNDLHYTWILMDFAPGMPLFAAWRELVWTAKVKLVRDIATLHSRGLDESFGSIGSLYRGDQRLFVTVRDIATLFSMPAILCSIFLPTGLTLVLSFAVWMLHSNGFAVGPLCTIPPSCLDEETDPLPSAQAWMAARLAAQKNELQTQALSNDTSSSEDLEYDLQLVNRLEKIVSRQFAAVQKDPFVLYLHDLHASNIFVDSRGHITAILDFERVITVPVWQACRVPRFLESRIRPIKPDRARYATYAQDQRTRKGDLTSEVDRTGLRHHGMGLIYWDHVEQYEKTLLRDVYFKAMQGNARWVAGRSLGVELRTIVDIVDALEHSFVEAPQEEFLGALEAGQSTADLVPEFDDILD